jgi:regulatory protein
VAILNKMTDINKILNNLRRQCSRREYCVSDVLKKAEKALDGDKEKASEVVKILVQEKYVDDLRYCEAYAREKSSISGWGEVKIRYMLSAKGISKDIIAQALTQIDSQRAEARLEKLLENKFRTLKDDPQWKMKLLRFALGRGYSYEEVNEQIQALMLSTNNL